MSYPNAFTLMSYLPWVGITVAQLRFMGSRYHQTWLLYQQGDYDNVQGDLYRSTLNMAYQRTTSDNND